MVEPIKKEHIKESEWSDELREVRPEISIPGYWKSLEDNCIQWAKDIFVGPYWSTASTELGTWIAQYRSETGGSLLARPGLPNFEGKSAKRIESKLYELRLKNENFKFDAFSQEGPPIPKLNDLVRTRVSCQYVDGVEFLGNKLVDLAERMGIENERTREGRLEGYFAQHINFAEDVFYRFGGGSEPGFIMCEIQLSTELATRVWQTTHMIYEESRGSAERAEEWQWNPKDARFVSRQLGHMIHLADGLLVQLRESTTPRKQKGVTYEH